MGELAIHLVGDGALLQHHDDMAGTLGERRNVQIDLAIAADARRAEIDLVLVDRRARGAHLIDQRQQGAAERHQLLQRLAPQELRGNLEEGFSRNVGIDDLAVGRDQQHGIGQGIEDGFAVGRQGTARLDERSHAAALQAKSSKASPSERCTLAGSSDVRMR
jgi:hypothetical protein